MINTLTVLNLIKSIDHEKLKHIFVLMVLFTIVLCFCKDEEFGGLIALHKAPVP